MICIIIQSQVVNVYGMPTAGRLQVLHKRLGISLEDLSTEARDALEKIVDLAIDLDLKDCSFTRLGQNLFNSYLAWKHLAFY